MTQSKPNGAENIKTKYSFWRKHRSLFYMLLVFFLVRGTITEAYHVPTGSMSPTIQIDDRILTTKFDFGLRLPFIKKQLISYETPKRGDIVVFTKENDPDKLIVKRVIALPGETIEIRNGQTYINGQWLPEPYLNQQFLNTIMESFGPLKVPANKLFLMGDNRNNSLDSRSWKDPFVPMDRLYGRARYSIWNGRMFSALD